MAEPASGLRVLYVVNGFPWPLTTGYLRHYFLIRELARRGHRVSLLSVVPAGFDPERRVPLEPWTERIVTAAPDGGGRSLAGRVVRRIRSVANGDPASRRLGEAAARLLAGEPHDVILFSGKRTYPALRAAGNLPVVADLCDATSSRIVGQLRHSSATGIGPLLVEYVDVRRVERSLVGRAAHLLFASTRDRQALVGDRRDGTTILPNGVDLDEWRRPDGQGLGRREIVFTGGMDYPPNTDAAFQLIREVLPRVRTEIPDAHLSIVGRDPTPALVAAGSAEGVTVTGSVPDVRPYLAAASVFAAPLRFGAGIQNKLLEALAMGLPIVASPNAAAGLVTADGTRPPLTVAEDPEAFAARLVERLRAAEADPTPPVDGRAFVEARFAWSRSGELLEAALLAAARAGSGAAAAAVGDGAER